MARRTNRRIPERPAAAAAGGGAGVDALRQILPRDRLLQSAASILAWSCSILIRNGSEPNLLSAAQERAFAGFLLGAALVLGGAAGFWRVDDGREE